MLTQEGLAKRLPCRGMGLPLHFHTTLPSTNDLAEQLALEGEVHGAVVVADEQTAGRGRLERRWETAAGTALALSLILRPEDSAVKEMLTYAGLGAVAVCEALERYGLEPTIKWPNDVHLKGKKAAGILAELTWRETAVDFIILGIGVNVHPGSVPDPSVLRFPGTFVAGETALPVSRDDLLREILCGVGKWLDAGPQRWMKAWERRLAYRDEEVSVELPEGRVCGTIKGLDPSGRLLLQRGLKVELIGAGEIHLEPVDRAKE
ncbi:MAG: biotin--[acetyl-CoA-carboxylase] ligase [Anaerolineales bacterium]|nr:biotin--[acetyl-CoA-carboxylase] ligase [Anaerolineales bacterium]